MRRILFWSHLLAGSLAGIVIFILSVTGILLAFERQINAWSDSSYHSSGPPAVDVWKIDGQPNVTLQADPKAAVALSYGRDRLLMMDGSNGHILGQVTGGTRAFFVKVEGVHRALGTPMRGGWGRPIVDACNLIFLGLVVSGIYLWMPRRWTRTALRSGIWFRSGLQGRAKNWNWHNTIGFWCFLPLFFVVLTGVIMSYQWANNLLFQAAGSKPTQGPPGRAAGDGAARGRRTPAAEGAMKGTGALLALAESKVPNWRSVSFKWPAENDRVITFNMDSGTGGQPQAKYQLAIERSNGSVLSTQDFSSNDLGRRLRTIARFLHTGEVLGLTGQVIAAVASLGGALLVWTGLSLSLQRLVSWRRRSGSSTHQSGPVSGVGETSSIAR